MTFQSGDKERIRQALHLHRDMGARNSLLQSLMDELERYDTREGTSYVSAVRANLTTIETLNTTIETESESDGHKIEDLDGRIRIERFAGGSSAASRNKRRRLIGEIKNYLDPDDVLSPYAMTGRVIPSI